MNIENHENQTSIVGQDHAEQKPPEGFLAFAARLKQKAEEAGSLNQIDVLRELNEAGDKDALELHIDDIVYEALNEDVEFTENIAKLRARRLVGHADSDEEARIRDRQNELFNEYKQHVVQLAGLPDEVAMDEFESVKSTIQEKIQQYIAEGKSNEGLLQELGILRLDKHGKEVFTYPESLFPKATNTKWELYLDRVRDHLRKERAVDAGTVDRLELEPAEEMRRLAHNSVTSDVHKLLGLDKLTDSSWDFLQTRGMLAKMRDSKYPTVDTAEKDKTTRHVLRAANALGALSAKSSVTKKG